ncbi:MAG: hypothetical protein QM765_04125 [Myxococcales bacterium]
MPSSKLNLLLTVPQGAITATNLGIEGYTWHRSPGSGKYFQGRYVLVDLALENARPAFRFLDEGGWRDANADTMEALEATLGGKRTKTALSNNAFSCTPIDAFQSIYLVKTGGETQQLENAGTLATFRESACNEGMSPEQNRLGGRPAGAGNADAAAVHDSGAGGVRGALEPDPGRVRLVRDPPPGKEVPSGHVH